MRDEEQIGWAGHGKTSEAAYGVFTPCWESIRNLQDAPSGCFVMRRGEGGVTRPQQLFADRSEPTDVPFTQQS